MKIVKIRFCNINSLKGIHEIDFSQEPLLSAGLFAITGVTGSGKTSILDVITLALYNRIPRLESKISKASIEKSGIILTRNMPDGFAEVTYECSSGEYSSKWSVSSTRNASLRDYEMEIADARTGNIIDVQKRDVPEKNAELIGLNYDQFVRAIILAQGDFATFLKAKSDVRGKLLEQITGGEIYRELGKMAFEMNKKHGQELEDAKQKMEGFKERLISDEALKELCENITKISSDIERLEKKENLLQHAINVKTELSKTEEKLTALAAQKTALEDQLKSFNENEGQALKKHQALVPVQEQVSKWKEKHERLHELTEKLEKYRRDKTLISESIVNLKSEIATLTGDKESEPLEALAALESTVLKLDQEISNTDTRFSVSRNGVIQLAAELKLRPDIPNLGEFIEVLKKKEDEYSAGLAEILNKLGEENLRDPDSTISSFRSAMNAVAEIIAEQKLLKDYQKNLNEIEESKKLVDTLLKKLPVEIKDQEKDLENLDLKLQLAKKEYDLKKQRASFEEHRKNLKEGEACPLCGSLHHPFADEGDLPVDDLLQAIEIQQEEHKLTNSTLITLKQKLGAAAEKKDELVKNLEVTESKIQTTTASIDAQLPHLPEQYRKQDMQEVRKKLESDINSVESYIKLQGSQKKLKELEENTDALFSMEKELSALRTERNKLFEGVGFGKTVQDIRERWTKYHSELKGFEDQLKESDLEKSEIEKHLQKLTSDIVPVIKPLGYEEVSAVFADLLSAQEAKRLHEKKSDIDNLIRDNQTESKVNLERQKELKDKDTDKDKKELEKEAEENKGVLKDVKEKQVDLKAKMNEQEDVGRHIQTQKDQIEKLSGKNEKWNLLNKYIGDSEGKKFSVFAQQLTLHKLILLANERLQVLDDRYMLSMPSKEEDDSLSIIDTHMGDLRRSVKSLSGGETFIISLAMALALSDLAARKINLESLFIDEGFGSLDKLTLDQTIDTLEKLQYESGKSIGVISHVEAMQERITTQIQVSKNGQGYSTLKII